MRLIIADDEAAARRRLKRLLESESDVEIVGEFVDGKSAINGIRELAPDVALLDIQMPEQDGLEVAKVVAGPEAPAIVFVTAFDHYALQAFGVHAVDYLVKPIEAARLRETLDRLRRRAPNDAASTDFARLARMIEEWRAETNGNRSEARRPRDRLLVAVDGRSILIPTAELEWIEAAGNYVKLHRGSTSAMLRESLASVEESLDPHLFARVHRSAIVNIAKIKEVQPWFSGSAILILSTGQRLRVSRSYRRQFESRFGVPTDE